MTININWLEIANQVEILIGQTIITIRDIDRDNYHGIQGRNMRTLFVNYSALAFSYLEFNILLP